MLQEEFTQEEKVGLSYISMTSERMVSRYKSWLMPRKLNSYSLKKKYCMYIGSVVEYGTELSSPNFAELLVLPLLSSVP